MQVTEETKAVASSILKYWAITGEHNQASWIDLDDDEKVTVSHLQVNNKKYKVCDSAMCAAGTAVFLDMNTKDFKKFVKEHSDEDDEWTNRAGELLGLDYSERSKLFYSDNDSALVLMTALAVGDEDLFEAYDANPL
jgi:hypothetical protein